MRKKHITIAIGCIILCLLLAGAFFYGKTRSTHPVRSAEKERVSAGESLKTNSSSSCTDEANKAAADKLENVEKQTIPDTSKSALETQIREELRTNIIDCSVRSF